MNLQCIVERISTDPDFFLERKLIAKIHCFVGKHVSGEYVSKEKRSFLPEIRDDCEKLMGMLRSKSLDIHNMPVIEVYNNIVYPVFFKIAERAK